MHRKIKVAFIVKDSFQPEEIVQAVALPRRKGKWRLYYALGKDRTKGFYRRLFVLFAKTYQSLQDQGKIGFWPQSLVGDQGALFISRLEEPGYHALAEYIRQANPRLETSSHKKEPRFKDVPNELRSLMYDLFTASGQFPKRVRLKIEPESIDVEFWDVHKFEKLIDGKISSLGPGEISIPDKVRTSIIFGHDPQIIGRFSERIHKYNCLKNSKYNWHKMYRQALYDDAVFRYFIDIKGMEFDKHIDDIYNDNKPMTIKEMLLKHRCVLLVGSAGAGKTTLLKHYAFSFCDLEELGNPNSTFGVYVNLEDFDFKVERSRNEEYSDDNILVFFLNYIADSICTIINSTSLGAHIKHTTTTYSEDNTQDIKVSDCTKIKRQIVHWLKNDGDSKNVFFFFDAYNTISTKARVKCGLAIGEFYKRDNCFVVSSHHYGIEDLPKNLMRFDILPVEKRQGIEYLRKRVGSPKVHELENKFLSLERNFYNLTSNPYYLSKIADILIGNPDIELPNTIGKLHQVIIERIILQLNHDYRFYDDINKWPKLFHFLKHLAKWFFMHTERNYFNYPNDLTELQLEQKIETAFLEFADRHGILRCENFGATAIPRNPQIRFSHDLVRDYFTACALKDVLEKEDISKIKNMLFKYPEFQGNYNVFYIFCEITEKAQSTQLFNLIIDSMLQKHPSLAKHCLKASDVSKDYEHPADKMLKTLRKIIREAPIYKQSAKDIFKLVLEIDHENGMDLIIDFACIIDPAAQYIADEADEILCSLNKSKVQNRIISYLNNTVRNGKYLSQLRFLLKYIQIADTATLEALIQCRNGLQEGNIKTQSSKMTSDANAALRDTLYRLGDNTAEKEIRTIWKFPNHCRIINMMTSKPLSSVTIRTLVVCCQKLRKCQKCDFYARCVICYFEKWEKVYKVPDELPFWTNISNDWLVEVASHYELRPPWPKEAEKLLGYGALCEKSMAVFSILNVAAEKDILDKYLRNYLACAADKYEYARELIIEALESNSEFSFKHKLAWVLARVNYVPYEYIRKTLGSSDKNELIATFNFLYYYPSPEQITIMELLGILKKQQDEQILLEGAKALRRTLWACGYLFEQIHPFVIQHVRDTDVEYEADLLMLLKWRDCNITGVKSNSNQEEKKLLIEALELLHTVFHWEYFTKKDYKHFHKEPILNIISKWVKISSWDFNSSSMMVKSEHKRMHIHISNSLAELLAHSLSTYIMNEYWLRKITAVFLKLGPWEYDLAMIKYSSIGYRTLDDDEWIEVGKIKTTP